MIEFSKTGPLGVDDHEYVLPLFIGVGGAGVAVVDQIRLQHEWIGNGIVAMDCDLQTVRASVAPDKFLLAKDRCRGMGGSIDPEAVAESVRDQHADIAASLEDRPWAVVVCGLGGTTGSGAAPELVRILNSRNTRVMVMAIMPFSFESEERQHRAREARERLETVAEIVWVCGNDPILSSVSEDEDLRTAFHEFNCQLASGLVDLSRVVHAESVLQLDVEDCQQSLGDGKASINAWVSHAEEKSWDSESLVVEALEGIQLQDRSVWDKADGLIAIVVGGRQLSMDQTQELIRALTGIVPDDLEVRTGGLSDPQMENGVRLTLIATRSLPDALEEEGETVLPEAVEQGPDRSELETSEKPREGQAQGEGAESTPAPPVAPALFDDQLMGRPLGTPQRYFSEQEELPLDKKADRGRFEKTDPTTVNGQDLDRPTFLRLGMSIRL